MSNEEKVNEEKETRQISFETRNDVYVTFVTH